MKINLFINLFIFVFICLLNSCSILDSGKKITVTKTENVIQKTPSGITEIVNATRTETTVEKNSKPTAIKNKNISNADLLQFPKFRTETMTIVKDGIKIHDTTYATDQKKVTTYKTDTIYHHHDIGTIIQDSDCYTTKVKVSANSSTFMNADYEAQAQHIYPGAIYYYKDFTSGKYKEIDFPRNQIKLSSDNPNISGSTWNLIDNPDYSSIRDGIASIYSRFDNRQVGTMNLRYQTYQSNTDAEFSLKISGGGSYGNFSLENEYKNTSKSNSQNLTIDAIKPLYTITCLLPKPYKNYFQSNDGIDINKNPIIIQSVTYGIRVLANFTLETDTKEALDNFKAHYSGIGSSAHVDFDYLEKHAKTDQTINCYVVGGPGNSTVAFDKKQLEDGLQNLIAGATYATARPISYEIRDLAGNIIETKSATDEITTVKCVPHVNAQILQSIILKIKSGGEDGSKDGKDGNTELWIDVYKGIGFSSNSNVGSLHENDDNNFPGGSIIMRHISGNERYGGINTSINNKIKRTDFVNNGGSIKIRIQPHGGREHDTWKIDQFTVSLVFADGTIEDIPFSNHFEVSDESKEYELFFKGDFKPH